MNLAVAAPLAALPIVIILVLMLGLGWSAAKAGVAGFALSAVLALSVFGLGAEVYPEIGQLGAMLGALSEAGFTSLTILWIIFPALCIYQLQSRTGAMEVLRRSLGRISVDPRIIAILIAWFFAIFLEGAAGFGTTVALAAPFLVSAGFNRVRAVTIALIGHSVGVSFGAVGTPIIPQMAATPFSGLELAQSAAIYHALLGWVMLVILVGMVSRGLAKGEIVTPEGKSGAAGIPWGWTLGAALLFLLPMYLLAVFVGPELPTLGGALLGGGVFVALVMRLGQSQSPAAGQPQAAEQRLLSAAAPYLVLVALILVSRLVAPLRETLQGVVWQWEVAETFRGSFQPLYHPGTMLFLGFLFGALWQRAPFKQLISAMLAAARQLGPVTIALVAMLALSRVMVHAQMIDTLADAAALVAGRAWPLFAPLVGVLGTFVTGSATASNILFTDFQYATANTLELPALQIVGAQNFGAAVGNIICPHNIVAAGATVGLTGEEGAILRGTLLPSLLYSVLGGVVALVLVGTFV